MLDQLWAVVHIFALVFGFFRHLLGRDVLDHSHKRFNFTLSVEEHGGSVAEPEILAILAAESIFDSH